MPSFSKILSDTDVRKQMAVDSDFVDHLPESRGGTENISVVDETSDTTWEFGYYARREGHPKPVFQGGWHEYRRQKGLKAGDRITFTADGGRYRIKAERKIILLGEVVWTPNFNAKQAAG